MPQSADTNRRWTLAERPKGRPDENTLTLETEAVPEPGPGEMLLRTRWLSLDPYMRGRMSDVKSYAAPVELGEVMPGQVVAEVVRSDTDGFGTGDLVLSRSGWQDYAVADGQGVQKLPALDNPSWALGVLGMPGFTAHAGLLNIGAPQLGETVVVAAASGPVGGTVGQIAKLKGCRAVGIAGGPEKCAHVVDTLGFDACIDHRAADFAERLAEACPDGIDVYFENVGGEVLYAVLPLLNPYARVPVCGTVAWYNMDGLPDGPDRGPLIWRTILTQKVKVQGFIVFDTFGPEDYEVFTRDMSGWVESGDIRYREHVMEGLEAAPQGFLDMLDGTSFGKTVVRVG